MSGQGYFYYGSEVCLVDEAVQAVLTKYPDAERALFEDVVAINDVIQAAQSPNLFVSHTVICIKNPYFFSKSPDKDEAKAWTDFFKMSLDPSVTVIVFAYGSVDMRKKCASSLKKAYQTTCFEPFKDWEDEKSNRFTIA